MFRKEIRKTDKTDFPRIALLVFKPIITSQKTPVNIGKMHNNYQKQHRKKSCKPLRLQDFYMSKIK